VTAAGAVIRGVKNGRNGSKRDIPLIAVMQGGEFASAKTFNLNIK
jgi:hypothetical protein